VGKLLQAAVFCPPTPPTKLSVPFEYVRTPHGSFIPVLMLWHAASNGVTFLYSHGNAEDLGQIVPLLDQLRTSYKVNVCCYDYTGYGLSKSAQEGGACPPPSEERVFSDADVVFEYLSTLNILPQDIVLYGRSLGSGPACYLAALHASRIRGLILCSPLLSCIQTQVSNERLKKYDVFDNQSRIPRITCPVLVMHGTKDKVVPFSHGQHFDKHLPTKPITVWVENAGHNNILQLGSISVRHGIAKFLRSTGHHISDSGRSSISSGTGSGSMSEATVSSPRRSSVIIFEQKS